MKAIKKKSSLTNEKGFTLIELMLALAIIIIAALGTASALVQVAKNITLSKNTTLASNLCQSKIEEVKSFGYNLALNSIEYHIDAEGNSGGNFIRVVRVSSGPIAETKLISVTVYWRDTTQLKRVQMPTIIANIIS